VDQALDRVLSAVVNGHQCTAYDFRWEFVDEPVKVKIKTQRYPVICVETGVVFKTAVSAVAWLKSIGFELASGANISRCARGVCPRAYGFSWKYVVR